jgi:hypothetical protein
MSSEKITKAGGLDPHKKKVDFEKLYVAILQFVLKGIFFETLKEEKICFPSNIV